jgi:pseudouridylate synthase
MSSAGQPIANPIAIATRIAHAPIDPVIATALTNAALAGIAIVVVTAFPIRHTTKGHRLAAKLTLVRNSACLAADITGPITPAR